MRARTCSSSSSSSIAARGARTTSAAPASPIHRSFVSPASSLAEPRANALVITGGTVHTPEGPRQVDIQVAGGGITSVGNDPPPAGAATGDAPGRYVLPGPVHVPFPPPPPAFPPPNDFPTP